MAEKQKKWYDKELKSRDGDVILLYGNDSKLEHQHAYEDEDYLWFGENKSVIFKDESWKNSPESDIFVSYLAKALSLPVLDVRPAIAIANNNNNSDVKGIIVENFQEKNGYVFSAADINVSDSFNTIDNIIKNLEHYKKELYESGYSEVVIDSNIETNLLKLFLLDYVTCEIDRNETNILFRLIEDEQGKATIQFGKIFDNSQAFFFTAHFAHKLKNLLNNETDFYQMVDQNYAPRLFFTPEENALLEFTCSLTPKIIEKVLQKPKLTEFLNKLINTNFDQVAVLIQKDNPEYKIPENKFNMAKKIFNHRVELLQKEFQKQQSQNKFKKNDETTMCY